MSHEWTFELKRGRLEGRAFLDVVAFSISNQGDIGGCSAQYGWAPSKLILSSSALSTERWQWSIPFLGL